MAGETWEQEKAKLEKDLADARQQLSGLSSERNMYRQRSDAWEKNVGGVLGDMLKIDPATGLPIGVDPGREEVPLVHPQPVGTHPLAGLSSYAGEGFSPAAVDTYYSTLFKQQGFLTSDQAKEWARQAAMIAYEAARGDMMVMRNYDHLTAKDNYKDLANPESDLSKRTSKILQERNLGAPLAGAKTFDQWRYNGLEALQMGADLARLEIHEEAQRNAQAGQAGQAAGMASGGAPSGGAAVSEERWMEAAEKGDLASMRQMISDHVSSVTGQQP